MKEILGVLIYISILSLFIKIWMIIARYIGEQLGVAKLFQLILSRLEKLIKHNT